MSKKRYSIVVVDKKMKFSFLFKGLRKHKYSVLEAETVDEITLNEITNFNLFFVVLYEFRDVFDLLLLNNNCSSNTSIIIASENTKILKKAKKIACYPIVDLSGKININNNFHDCIQQFLE